MEKLVLSLVFVAKRLRRYFQAYPITVITDQLIKQVMSRPDMAGRLQKWSIMLGEHNITYRPRTSVTGQILTDFLIEMSGEDLQAVPAAETQEEPWTLFTDGSSCVDGSNAGLILTIPEGVEFTYALRFQFIASNNEAEYEALIAGLRIVARMGVKDVHVSVDSKLVANQVLGTYVAKEDNMVKYLEIVRSLLGVLVQTGTSQSAQRQIHKGEGSGNGDRGRRTNLDDTVSGLLKRIPPRRQEGGKKAPPQGPTIRVNRGGPLLTVVPYAVVKIRQTAPAKAKSKMTKYYNARVRVVTFKPGDFVYRSNDASHAVAGGKLGPKWKGPYEVTKALGNGPYKLRSMDGTILSRT
nr:reverse transcriptase domain-containing protein [Tanacetum cinerariifolium]GEX91492.1 reverse transcriptase domain-containing protein [Tanacetum cinerariifolium]